MTGTGIRRLSEKSCEMAEEAKAELKFTGNEIS